MTNPEAPSGGHPMTADRYASALAAIEARRELVEAATAGPWQMVPVNGSLRYDVRVLPENTTYDARGDSVATAADSEFGACRADDAALIVAAVNAFAADTDALAAVLERHAPDAEPVDLYLHFYDEEECETCEGGGHSSIVCKGCFPSHEGMDGHTVWPCPDAQSVLTALEMTS